MLGLLLVLDLGFFHRRAHHVHLREAVGWSIFWVALGVTFGAAVYVLRGPRAGIEYFTAYIVEKSLSVDNLFVIAMVFNYFKVDPRWQHRVLFWGIIGALVMRGVVIVAGVSVLERFGWTEYLFGVFLVYSGVKMLATDDDEEDFHPERNVFVRIARRMLPISDGYHGNHLFVQQEMGGRRRLFATPLLIVLLVVESADLLFAVDSIPAVLAVTRDTFVVLTSNIFAILGLRALFFVLAGVIDRFHYLKLGVCVILVFVGAKMLVTHTAFAVSTPISLAVILGVLTTAAVFSVWRERRRDPEAVDEALSEHVPAPERLPEEYAGP